MSTPYESANLILKIFEMRREPLLREARTRTWFVRGPRRSPENPQKKP